MNRCTTLAALVAVGATAGHADVSLNNMFGDHMVLQQGIKNRVWGKADPGEAVTVTFAPDAAASARRSAGCCRTPPWGGR